MPWWAVGFRAEEALSIEPLYGINSTCAIYNEELAVSGGAGLPIWLQYTQTISVVIIALVGAWIAFRQMQIATTKLQFDLFERRYRVFDATRRLLIDILVNGDSSQDSTSAFILGVADAIFLFDDRLVNYLHEMQRRATALKSIQLSMQEIQNGDERAKATEVAGTHREWLIRQEIGLPKQFEPFLRLTNKQRTVARWKLRL